MRINPIVTGKQKKILYHALFLIRYVQKIPSLLEPLARAETISKNYKRSLTN